MDLWVKAKINPFPKNIISISDNVNIVDVFFSTAGALVVITV